MSTPATREGQAERCRCLVVRRAPRVEFHPTLKMLLTLKAAHIFTFTSLKCPVLAVTMDCCKLGRLTETRKLDQDGGMNVCSFASLLLLQDMVCICLPTQIYVSDVSKFQILHVRDMCLTLLTLSHAFRVFSTYAHLYPLFTRLHPVGCCAMHLVLLVQCPLCSPRAYF